MLNARLFQPSTLASLLAALLLVSAPALQPAYADDDDGIEIGDSDDASEHAQWQEGEEDVEDYVVTSDPNDGGCGATVENSRC